MEDQGRSWIVFGFGTSDLDLGLTIKLLMIKYNILHYVYLNQRLTSYWLIFLFELLLSPEEWDWG